MCKPAEAFEKITYKKMQTEAFEQSKYKWANQPKHPTKLHKRNANQLKHSNNLIKYKRANQLKHLNNLHKTKMQTS
jgi:hypothetical protein